MISEQWEIQDQWGEGEDTGAVWNVGAARVRGGGVWGLGEVLADIQLLTLLPL